MKTSRLFRTIWRVNGVLLLLTFVVAVGAVVVAAAASITWGRHDGGDPPAAVEPATGERLFFGSTEEVDGSSLVLLPLEAHGGREAGFSSGGSETLTRNLLFYDAATGAAHWLLPGHRAVIVDHELIRASGAAHRSVGSPPAAANDPVRWIRYELATADTNHDGQIRRDDAWQVAVSAADGTGLAVVLEGVDRVLGYASPERGKLVVFFRRGDQELAAEVDLAARKLARTVPLPKS
jgi:hypothetical protein